METLIWEDRAGTFVVQAPLEEDQPVREAQFSLSSEH